MRKSITLATGTLSLTAALLLSGCTATSTPATSTAPSTTVPSATTAPQASDTPSQVPETASPQVDAAAVASLYEDLFNGVYHVSNSTKSELESLNAKYSSLSPVEFSAQMTDLVPAFAQIDGSNTTAKAAYIHSLMTVTIPILESDTTGLFKDLKYSVDESKIKLAAAQTEATMPLSAVRGTYKGKTQAGSGSSLSYAMKVAGQWLIDPTRG